uniref:Radical_SAM domain-containing protein n=1 Tax=Steinernema glaseri TaxID=37863 RepID=A0A1I7XYW3_9BILA
MESVPAVFIERVTGILSLATLNVLVAGQPNSGRWAVLSIPNLSNSFDLCIGVRDGKKFSRCESDGRSLDLVDVFPLWNSATCHFKNVDFCAVEAQPNDQNPMTEKQFSALKKMIANQRRRIFKIQINSEDLMVNFADLLEVCGGPEVLHIGTNMTRVAPILKKLISDGGFGLGNMTRISLNVDNNDTELHERLIHMAVNHILKQEHKYYGILYPEKYAHLMRPLQSQLKHISSQSTIFAECLYYSHPGKNTTVTCVLNREQRLSYWWRRR